jgi:hypothetical protein
MVNVMTIRKMDSISWQCRTEELVEGRLIHRRSIPLALLAFTLVLVTARGQDQTGNAPAGQAPAAPATNRVAGIENLEPGVYYRGAKDWVRLEQITMAGGGIKHMGKMFVPGLTPQMVWMFRGAEAPVRISEPRPTFYIKQPPYIANVPGHSEHDLVLVRLDRKKDHRELQTTSGGSALTFKAGFSKERTPEILVTHVSESVFTVIPKADLAPNEYFLTFGSGGVSGYDFGIDGGK